MNDLTKGKIGTTLLKFAVPFILASFLQALYGAADLFMVGRFSSSSDVAAVAIGSQLMQTITGIILGIATGGTVLIGHHIGKKDQVGVARSIGALAMLFVAIGIPLTLGMGLLTNSAVAWMKTPIDAVQAAQHYVFVCAMGIPFIIGYNVMSAIFRGLGDSKSPFYFVLVACITNIVVDFILVGSFDMGAYGAALATILAQGISFILAILYSIHKKSIPHFERKYFKLAKEPIQFIFKVGMPLALQDGLVNISFLIITAIINTMGLVASASLGVVEKIIVFAMLPPAAFGSAISAMSAQNIGAGLEHRAIKILRYGILYSLVFGITATTYCQIYPQTLTALFTSDPEVVKVAASYLMSFSIDCIMVSFVFCMNGYFSGSGQSLFSLIHSLIATFGVRIPLTYVFSRIENVSIYTLGLAAPAASLVSIVICMGYFYCLRKKGLLGKDKVSEIEYAS